MSGRAGGLFLACALVVPSAPTVAQDWRGPEELEVRVEDAKGKPLAGAEVVLEHASGELGGPAPLLTDERGRLAVGGLLPGRWALEVRKPGYMSFRAEIALAGGEKPRIVLASQHNVPGAVSAMRVRLARARGAPPAPARVERVAPPGAAPPVPPRPAPVPSAPAAPVPAPRQSPPAVAAPPAAPPEPPAPFAPRPESPPAEAPSAPSTAPPPPASPPPAAQRPLSPPATPPGAATVETRPTAPTPAPPPPAFEAAAPPAAIPAPPAPPRPRVTAAAPIARACYECRPGESALFAESEIAAGGAGCPADLSARLAAVPRAEVSALAAALPGGCAVMVVELPANARYVGFRFEAAGGNGRSEDCLPGRDCPAGGCRFRGEPVIREEAAGTWLVAAFESTVARRGGFTVYWRRTR